MPNKPYGLSLLIAHNGQRLPALLARKARLAGCEVFHGFIARYVEEQPRTITRYGVHHIRATHIEPNVAVEYLGLQDNRLFLAAGGIGEDRRSDLCGHRDQA